jgi:protein TonB
MNPAAPYKGSGKKLREITLWTGASVLVLSAHIAAAALMLQQEPELSADSAPPAAIMIELAPEPEAVNTEEEQIAPDPADSKEVESEEVKPVEQAQPEPEPQPVEEPIEEPVEPPPPEVAELPEPTPPEPVVEEPPPEIAELPDPVLEPLPEPIVEPPPELVEQPDPIEQQITAALENVEVPLPTLRPAPPPPVKPEVAKKPEPKKEPVKQVERRKQRQEQAQKEMAQAKAQVQQSTRNAASQSATGSVSTPKVSPARWMSSVRSKIARNARRCPGGDKGVVAVSFSFDNSGNIGRVSVSRSSGNSAIDDYVTTAIRRASPIPTPPAGVASTLTQAVECK